MDQTTSKNTPEDRYLNLDGTSIRYRDTGGDGPVVLLTHGIAGSLEMWYPQLSAFGTSLRIIAWDLPGHGLSALGHQPYDPDKFATVGIQFLDALKIETVILAGNSMGGAISLRMAGLQPHRVKGLLLADSAALSRSVVLSFRLMTLPILGEIMNRPGPMAIDQQLKGIFHNPAVVTEELRAVVTRNVMQPGHVKPFLATMRLMSNITGQSPAMVKKSHTLLAQMRVPTVILHGREDAVLPLEGSLAAHELAPQSEMIILENCGHTPQIEQQDQFNSVLRDLVAKATTPTQ
jgi:pimeloyl-ACP methyl ester carboxylesterase